MNGCIRSGLTSGLIVIGVSALVATSVAPPPPPARFQAPPIALVAQVQPLPMALAAVAPLDLIAEQVSFHIGFVGDFLGTGAVLFAREFAIPGTLLQDIQNGTPVPVAFGRALQSFADVELEAGARLVGFAAQYVSFQIQFLTNLVQNVMTTVGNTAMAFVTFAVGVVGQLVTSVATGLTPATSAPARALSTSAAPAVVVTTPRATDVARSRPSADTAVGSSHDPVGAASNSDDSTAPPRKPKLTVMTTAVRAEGEVRSKDPTATEVDAAVSTARGGDGGTHPSATHISEKTSSVSGDNAMHAAEPGGQHFKHDAKPKGDNADR
jgi:hypothetical protein